MKKRLVWVMILALLVSILPASAAAVSGSNPTQPALQDVMQDNGNGEFIICIQKEGKWIEIGSEAYGSFVQEKEIEIGSLSDLRGDIKIRIVSKGGGSAHLDSVLLDGKAPAAVNKGGPAALKKLSEMDFDLISIDNTGIELDFAEGTHNGKLSIAGRIESVEIGQIPFQFPLSNLYKQIDMQADFYTYDLNSSQGSLTVDGILETAESSKEFFKEYCRPGSGHPFGYIYGWVMNDSENLYVSLDVTPDNTIDGDKDYAKVYVKTAEGVKEFKVSLYETKWGSSAFNYTDKVEYEHKTYEFKIPFNEIGIEDAASYKEVSLAFAAYGTMSAPELDYNRPDAVYGDGNYLVVYEIEDNRPRFASYGYGSNIFAAFVNQEGKAEEEFPVASNQTGRQRNPHVAYSNEEDSYLVVWQDDYDNRVFGQRLDDNGERLGNTIEVSVTSDVYLYQFNPDLAYSNADNLYLVVYENRDADNNFDIFGRFISASDGEPLGDQFRLSDYEENQSSPAVAYNQYTGEFLVTWHEIDSWDTNVYGQFIKYNPENTFEKIGSKFTIGELPDDDSDQQRDPSVTSESTGSSFFVTWTDGIFPSHNIYGCKVTNDNGTAIVGDSELISDNAVSYYDTSGDSDTAYGLNRFLTVWYTLFDESYESWIHWRPVDADDGKAMGNAEMLTGDRYLEMDPTIAYNNDHPSFLVAYRGNLANYSKASEESLIFIGYKIIDFSDEKYIVSIEFDEEVYELDEGETRQTRVIAVYNDDSEEEITDLAIFLTSDSEGEYISIGENTGIIEGLAPTSGTPVEITARYLGFEAKADVIINAVKTMTGIKFVPDEYSVQTGKSKQTYVMPVYSDGTVGKTPISTGLTFTSDDPGKVTIDPTGKITGVSQGSDIIIRASYSEEIEAYRVLDTTEDSSPFTATAIVNVTAATVPGGSGGGSAPAIVGQILVDGKVIKNIYEKDVSLKENTYTFETTKAGDEARLWLLGSFFEKLGKNKKDPTLIFDWTDASYSLPFKCIDIKEVADELKASSGGTKLNIIIQKAGKVENSKAEKTAEALGAGMVSGLMNFKVEVDAGSKGKKSIDSYDCYVSRTLKDVPDIDTLDTSGMKFLTDPDQFVFAPSIVEYDKDDGIMTIKYRGNGSYTILHYPRSFSDASAHWGKRNIETLASRLIVMGREKDTFAPDNWITRGEFASMLVRALGITEEKGDVIFSDLTGRWYEDDVSAASNAGLVLGRGDGQFYPDDRILREEMAAMICRAISFTDMDIEIDDADSVLARFKDNSAISAYAKEYIAYCAQNGIILGRDTGDFAPLDNATRAEASAMVERMLKYIKFIN